MLDTGYWMLDAGYWIEMVNGIGDKVYRYSFGIRHSVFGLRCKALG